MAERLGSTGLEMDTWGASRTHGLCLDWCAKFSCFVSCKQVPNASAYGTHSLRRGHARDLLESGATLAEILRAGQWKSAAFMRYLNMADIEKVACAVLCCSYGMRFMLRALCSKLLATQMMSSGSTSRFVCPSALVCDRFSHHIACMINNG